MDKQQLTNIFETANISCDMFNDGLYFKEQAELSKNSREKERYYRCSLMNFCASAEAWIYKIMLDSLIKKEKLTTREEEILKFLNGEPDAHIPKGLASIRTRITKDLESALCLSKQILNKNKEVKNYIKLSETRNMILHPTDGEFEKIYGSSIKNSCEKAPEIIENLFKKISKLTNNTSFCPEWFGYRKSEKI